VKPLLIAGTVLAGAAALAAQDDQVARARAIHYTMRLSTQVTLPKMKEGGLVTSFFIVYVGQGDLTPAGYDAAYRAAIAKFDAIHRLTEQIAPNEIGLALTRADVTRIAKSGRRVAVIGVENAYPIGTDLRRVKEFYDRGGRYMSVAHNGHNQLADSHTGEAGNEWKWGGLSPLGRQVIEEMNRLGMMVDVSHPSKAAMLQAVGLSRAPVIASHSSVRKLANQSRNMDDEMLMAIKTNGGVVQINAVSDFIKAPDPRGLAAATTTPGPRPPAAPATYRCPVDDGGSRASGPADAARPRATVKDYVDHIDYAVKLIGIDHVGIASDFDGGGGIDGFNSAADAFNVTLELVRRGYTEQQIAKIWGGNLLRVWGEVERAATPAASRRVP
jgi:membrane dipeptidase